MSIALSLSSLAFREADTLTEAQLTVATKRVALEREALRQVEMGGAASAETGLEMALDAMQADSAGKPAKAARLELRGVLVDKTA